MKTSRLALALIMAFSGPGIANEETIDLESRERSVRVIENRLKEREAQ